MYNTMLSHIPSQYDFVHLCFFLCTLLFYFMFTGILCACTLVLGACTFRTVMYINLLLHIPSQSDLVLCTLDTAKMFNVPFSHVQCSVPSSHVHYSSMSCMDTMLFFMNTSVQFNVQYYVVTYS